MSSSDTFSISLSDICNNMSSSSSNNYYCSSSSDSKSCSTSSDSKSCSTSVSNCKPCGKSSSSSNCTSVDSSSCATSNSCSNTESSSCNDKCKPCVDTKCQCKQLVKSYEKNKNNIKANNESSGILDFILKKFEDAKPVIAMRVMENYTVNQNIAWVESFIDKVLCVVAKNNVCKTVKVHVCKHKNDTEMVSNRIYTLKMTFEDPKVKSKEFVMDFQWRQLALNNNLAFIAIIKEVVKSLILVQVQLKAENSQVFF